MNDRAPGDTLQIAWRYTWRYLRPILGWLFILLGILGFFLPFLQGVLFLALGILLVGRRNRVVRWLSVHLKLCVRRWAAVRTPVVGQVGRWALRSQRNISRRQRHLHWWMSERLARARQRLSERRHVSCDETPGEC